MGFALKAPHGRLHTERRRQAVRFSTHDLLRARQVPDAGTRWWAPIYAGFRGFNADQRQPALVGVVTASVTAIRALGGSTPNQTLRTFGASVLAVGRGRWPQLLRIEHPAALDHAPDGLGVMDVFQGISVE